MSTPMAAPASDTGTFWSIERAVAFVVGPIVSAGAGWLSLFLANNVPGLPAVPGQAIYGLAGAATLSTAALFHKWLDGRSKQTQALLGQARSFEHLAQPLLSTAGITPGVESGFIHTTLVDLEGLAQHAAAKAVAGIQKAAPASTEYIVPAAPPPVQPIQPATNDPAPVTPVQAQAADAGAAQGV